MNSTIHDIESCGLYVEAVCTDNYPLNVRLYKFFSADSKLEPRVQHPCNPQRSLILFFDIVHIIKSIRNNWLNLKDYENTFIFPKFDANISINHFTSSSTYPVLCYAHFQDIRNLFKSDKFNVLKRAPKLTANPIITYAPIFPHIVIPLCNNVHRYVYKQVSGWSRIEFFFQAIAVINLGKSFIQDEKRFYHIMRRILQGASIHQINQGILGPNIIINFKRFICC